MHNAIVIMVAVVIIESGCVSYSFLFIVFLYHFIYIHLYQSHELIKRLKKNTNKILKEHSQNESENIQVFYLFFSFSFFHVFFLKLNQTLIVGYQVTREERLTILCSVLVSLFFGGGGRWGGYLIILNRKLPILNKTTNRQNYCSIVFNRNKKIKQYIYMHRCKTFLLNKTV